MKTLKNVVDFIREKHEGIKDWTYNEIAIAVIRATNNDTLVYTLNEKEEFTGIVVGEPIENNTIKVYFIYAPNNLKIFIDYFKKRFNNKMKLTWFSRKNRKRFYYARR